MSQSGSQVVLVPRAKVFGFRCSWLCNHARALLLDLEPEANLVRCFQVQLRPQPDPIQIPCTGILHWSQATSIFWRRIVEPMQGEVTGDVLMRWQ